jgi:hypothetical protein
MEPRPHQNDARIAMLIMAMESKSKEPQCMSAFAPEGPDALRLGLLIEDRRLRKFASAQKLFRRLLKTILFIDPDACARQAMRKVKKDGRTTTGTVPVPDMEHFGSQHLIIIQSREQRYAQRD